ncbi:glycosyltransferase family 2 protein [Streptomyces sp. MCAF7]
MLISIVVPCYNEEAVIDRFHEHLTRELRVIDHDCEFVYVDDGSKDRTLSLLKKLAETDPRVRYVSFSRNFGKEAAMLDRVTRVLTARAYYRLINRFVDVELVDGVGDFRLLSRRAVDAVLGLTEYNRFSKGLFAWVGFPSVTFEYENAVREEGRSKWTFGQLLNYGADGLISFNNKPLRAAVYLGLLLLSVAALYAAWIVGSAAVNGVDTPGYVTLLVVITALAGVQMVMVGVIGEYIGRIYYEVKRRPHFLVQSTNAVPAATPAAAPLKDQLKDFVR